MIFNKHKYLLFAVLAVTVFLSLFQPVLASEVDYPILNIPTPGGGFITLGGSGFANLNQYIVYIFWFFIITSGGIGIISIAISAFKILASFGKPEAIAEARKNIFSIILGIFLLMASVIIFTTINSDIINFTPSTILVQDGVYLRGTVPTPGTNDYIQAPPSESNTENIQLFDPTTADLFFSCPSSSSGGILYVWTYDQKNFLGNVNFYAMNCNSAIPISTSAGVYSFRRQYREPGVYFYSENDCELGAGYPTLAQKSKGKVRMQGPKSMQIISGLNKNDRYGVILGNSDQGIEHGYCDDPVVQFDPGESICYNIEDANYAYILKYRPDYYEDPATFGKNSVWLYSDNLYARIIQKNDPTTIIPYDEINKMYIHYPSTAANGNPDEILRRQYKNLWTDIGPYENECCIQETTGGDHPCTDKDYPKAFGINDLRYPSVDGKYFQTTVYGGNCLKEIDTDGTYYVIVYARNTASGKYMCQDLSRVDSSSALQKIKDDGLVLFKIVVIPKY